MWSDSYRDYVEKIVKTNLDEYPYYVAHTCTYWDLANSSAYPAFKVYLSKEKITSTGLYTYQLPADSICYNVVGGNANRTYHDERITITSASGRLTVDEYEFLYTNAESNSYTVQPDILSTTEVTKSHFDGLGLCILIVLLGVLVFKIVRR